VTNHFCVVILNKRSEDSESHGWERKYSMRSRYYLKTVLILRSNSGELALPFKSKHLTAGRRKSLEQTDVLSISKKIYSDTWSITDLVKT
jgi:hypothetical protein